MTATRDRSPSLTQTQSVYQSLRDAILGVELRPGEAISERWLEGRLAASRTPVRSALVRLEGEGLVQRQGRGYVVTPIDIGEIEQAYVFRETIETTVVRLAAARADALDLSGIGGGPPNATKAKRARQIISATKATELEDWKRSCPIPQ